MVVCALCVLPIFTLGICLTTPWHEFMRVNFEMIATSPVHIVSSERGPWFWYHTAYCYILAVTSLVMVIRQHAKVNPVFRRTSTLMLCILLLCLSGNVLVLGLKMSLDISLLTASISALLLYFLMQHNQSFDFFLKARREVFRYIGKAVFIVDNDDVPINRNRKADRFMEDEMHAVPGSISYAEGVERLHQRTVRTEEREDTEEGTDYYLDSGEVYNIRKKPILDNDGNQLGTFLIVSDVKQNRQLIRYLDDIAGMDMLTGLSNRRKMQLEVQELDTETNLPLAVITGDLNGLKSVNDTLGHQQGDVYIRMAAGILKAMCPPYARIARVGGDEFCIVIQACSPAAAKKLLEDIETAFADAKEYAFQPSMALGYAVKTFPEQDLQELMNTADLNMYEEKRRWKQGRHITHHVGG